MLYPTSTLLRTLSLLGLCVLLLPGLLHAQSSGTITGTVTDADTGEPLVGTSVGLQNTPYGTATNDDGAFVIRNLAPGTYTLEARFVGFRRVTERVDVPAGGTVEINIALTPTSIGLGDVEVTALRPDLQPESSLQENTIRKLNPRDTGETMRVLPGINAARRGAIGLDPNVRGLTETEVGAYVDGVRRFPAGPLRMDSQVSHFDPSTIDRVEVVKGPYALIWGAGNMSAIRVHTKDVPRTTGLAQGTVRSSYDTNYGAVGLTGALYGAEGDVTYWAHGAYREGHNYEAGGGTEIPADYRSAEGRGKLSYHLAPGSRITVAGGYQDQRDIDYPGRLLDADFFEAYDVSARYERTRSDGLLRNLEVLAYWHGVDHGMDNEEKPTRQAGQFPNGMPRPPLLISVDASMRNLGGRVAAELAPSERLRLTVGGDLYSANRDAERPFFAVMPNGNTVVPPFYRGPDGDPLDEVWPDVTITDAGLFANARQFFGPVSAFGTVRLDLVWADAARPTPVYLETVGASDAEDLSATETNLSAAATLSLPLDDAWTVSAGVGSVVRTADALERYADRFPASKAQTSAEFVGNPDLDPERATQADLWLEGVYPRIRLSLNGFYRVMNNYITLTPTDLDKLLPLSPDTVFRYVNGEATFYGGEATAAYAVLPTLTASVSASYLWGRDDMLDEPALGVSPLSTEIGLRYAPQSGRFFAEGGVNVVAEQDRVATTRGETATDGYVIVDLRSGVEITRGVDLLVGVQNLTDEAYVNHLNAKNPFTGTPIPEPGRVIYTSLSLSF